MNKKCILIVDDDPEACDFVEDLLSSTFAVLKVGNVAEALKVIPAAEPDLLLIDIKFGGENGLDLCENMRQSLATRHIPVIIYTGTEDDDAPIQAFERGADDFIRKTVRVRELVARISAKIRRLSECGEFATPLSCGNLTLDPRTSMVYLRKKLATFNHILATVYGAGYILRENSGAQACLLLESRI